jgi:hypothetical protein
MKMADDPTFFRSHLYQACMLVVIQNAVLPSQSESRLEALRYPTCFWLPKVFGNTIFLRPHLHETS